MTDVFISYKSERRLAAEHLASIIRAYSFGTWVDYEGLRPGEGYERRLEQKIKESKVVLVLWCRLSVKSDWVRKEASWAMDAGTYLPAWIEKSDLPAEFASNHTLSLTSWNGSPLDGAVVRLVSAIGDKLERNPVPNWDLLTREQHYWERFGRKTLAQFALKTVPIRNNGTNRRSQTNNKMEVDVEDLVRQLLQNDELLSRKCILSNEALELLGFEDFVGDRASQMLMAQALRKIGRKRKHVRMGNLVTYGWVVD